MKADRQAEHKDLEAAIDAIQHHRYEQAMDDLQRAESLIKNETDTLKDATSKIHDINVHIFKHVDRQ